MAQFTNKQGLPEAVVRAITNDSYDKGDADFSVTELLLPPRIWALKKLHAHAVTEDVEDRLWALYGQLAHSLLERANMADLAEKRFFMDISGYTISGQIDSLSLVGQVLSDYKFTSVWGFMKGREPKQEHVAQLNMQHLLLKRNGLSAKKLQIIGLLRDWMKSKAKVDFKYPQGMIAVQDIPMWSDDKTEALIVTSIAEFHAAKERLPLCSSGEHWAFKRCSSYCMVSEFCDQWNAKQQTEAI